jgi:hypothetical protein
MGYRPRLESGASDIAADGSGVFGVRSAAHVGYVSAPRTRRLVAASAPLRNPQRDTVLCPGLPIRPMRWKRSRGLPGSPRRARLAVASRSGERGARRRERALVLWVNSPAIPSSVATGWADRDHPSVEKRSRIVVAATSVRRVCAQPRHSLGQARWRARDAQLVKRSNLAGMRVGFAGCDLVAYLVGTRKHAGLMAPIRAGGGGQMRSATATTLMCSGLGTERRARTRRPQLARPRTRRRAVLLLSLAPTTTAPTTVGRSPRNSRRPPACWCARRSLREGQRRSRASRSYATSRALRVTFDRLAAAG